MIPINYEHHAKNFGFQEAVDEDGPEPLLVVHHDIFRVHFTGDKAWEYAVKWLLNTFKFGCEMS